MKRIIITGAAGFIGSNYFRYFIDNHKDIDLILVDDLTYAGNMNNFSGIIDLNNEISIINKKLEKLDNAKVRRFANFMIENDKVIFIKCNICDEKIIHAIFDKYEIGGVINFAAESHVDRSISKPDIFLRSNIMGTHVLLNECKNKWLKDHKLNEYKFLQISTDEVYGSLDTNGYFSEDTPLDPHSPYSASKASADLIVRSYYETYKLPINITRCSNNYGPYQFPEKLIPLIIMNALNNKRIPIYGDGEQIRDWLYVLDHCRAIDRVFESGRIGEIYNIGGNNEKKNIDVTKKIIEILRRKVGSEHISDSLIEHVEDRLGHDRRYAIDASKIKKELGWSPETDFEEGLETTIDWYLNNQQWLEDIITGRYKRMDHT